MSPRPTHRPAAASCRARLAAIALVAALAPACGPDVPDPRAAGPDVAESAPDGAVYRMSGEWITAAEVDALAEALAVVSPSHTLPHRRRVALTRVLLPRARAHELGGARLRNVRESLDDAVRRVEAGEMPEPERTVGTWRTFGVVGWLALRDTPVGEWSPTFEDPGRLCRAKVLSRDGHAAPGQEVFECVVLCEPYVDASFTLDPTRMGGRLEVVADDRETWRDLLPTRWLYELEGTDR